MVNYFSAAANTPPQSAGGGSARKVRDAPAVEVIDRGEGRDRQEPRVIEQALRRIPLPLPVGAQQLPMQRCEIGTRVRARRQQRIDAAGLRFALDRDQIDLDQGRVAEPLGGFLADDQVHAVELAEALEPRGQVHRIAEQRIVKMLHRPEIADAALAAVDPDADSHRCPRSARRLRLVRPKAVQFDQLLAHGLSGADRVLGVLRVVERGVPKRHDAIADVFVDGSLQLGDDLGHRRQKAVHELGQGSGVHAFGEGSKAADVAKHDRHHPHFAAEREPFGMGREFLDIVRRHVARKGVADLALARLGAQIADQRRREVNERQHRPRVDRVDQQPGIGERNPRRRQRRRHRSAAEKGARQRPDPRQHEDQHGHRSTR